MQGRRGRKSFLNPVREGLPTTHQVTPPIHQHFAVTQGPFCEGSGGYEASLPRFALGYNPLEWSPALAAGPYLPRTSVSVLHAGVPLPFSIRQPWSRSETQSCLCHVQSVRPRLATAH